MYDATELSLLLDLGNTRLKWVWVRDGSIIEDSLGRGASAEFPGQCTGPEGGLPGRILLSSVASDASTQKIAADCTRKFGVTAQVLRSSSSLAGIENGYRQPGSLGIDRWLAIVGAACSYGTPVVVMDLGTATTLDAVDGQGRHLGGLILPGPALMLSALSHATSMPVPTDLTDEREPHRDPVAAGSGPAASTSDAIRQGIIAAQIGALNEFLRHVSEGLKARPKVVLTGGAAEGILTLLEGEAVFDPWLVFKGMLQVKE